MSNVLIIATDPMIGGLLGQLTELAGHAAQFRRANEEASEAVRTSRPDVVLVDAAYGRASLRLAAEAAADVGAPVVYFGTAVPVTELRRFALGLGAKYFALPAGPKLLSRVLAAALGDHRQPPHVPDRLVEDFGVATAAAAVARARALAAQSHSIRSESRLLLAEREAVLANCRQRYAELREAVIAYTRALRQAGVPPDKALERVKDAVRADAPADEPERSSTDVADAVEWCLQAYYAA